MSGELRNQLELPHQLAEFFDDISREDEVARIRLPNGGIAPRPLTYRGTDYGQWTEIWRLGLPTPRMGGPVYPGRVIRFDRSRDNQGHVYDLTVVEAGSSEARQWRRQSSHVASTGGPAGREYGFW
jgi:hypothetical protein